MEKKKKKTKPAPAATRSIAPASVDGERLIDAVEVAGQAALLPIVINSIGSGDAGGQRINWEMARDAVAAILRHFRDASPEQIQSVSERGNSTYHLRLLAECLRELWAMFPRLENKTPQSIAEADKPRLWKASDTITEQVAGIRRADGGSSERGTNESGATDRYISPPNANSEAGQSTERLDVPDIDDELLRTLRTPKRRKLATYLWKRNNVTADELWRFVWCEAGAATLDTVLQFVRAFNRALRDGGMRHTKIDIMPGGVFYLTHPQKEASSRQEN